MLRDGESLKVAGAFGIISPTSGTSFAAPKIARLAASLISKNYTPLEAKAAIINFANRETPKNVSSLFGYVNEYNEELTSLKTTLHFDSTKTVKYFDINLENVDKVSIAWANYANSLPSLGEEYSISNFNVSLIKYEINWDKKPLDKLRRKPYTPEKYKKTITPVKTNAWSTNYEPEKNRRIYEGKYFTSHKVEYSLLNNNKAIKSHEHSDWKYAIRIKRLELFDTVNIEPLKVGINIFLSGTNFSEEDFIMNNSAIIEVGDLETIIEV